MIDIKRRSHRRGRELTPSWSRARSRNSPGSESQLEERSPGSGELKKSDPGAGGTGPPAPAVSLRGRSHANEPGDLKGRPSASRRRRSGGYCLLAGSSSCRDPGGLAWEPEATSHSPLSRAGRHRKGAEGSPRSFSHLGGRSYCREWGSPGVTSTGLLDV